MLDGRIMGLDIGDKTIGVAVSDIMGITAQGVKTIRRESKKKDIEELKNIIKERQVNKIVSGLPKNMNGTLGPQGEKVLKLCELIKEETGLEIDFWDERLTTVAAERSLIEGDVSRKKRKKVIAVPRLAKYGEHVDDHQLQLVSQFRELDLIYSCEDGDLKSAIETVKKTKYKEYESNTQTIMNSLEEFIKEV